MRKHLPITVSISSKEIKGPIFFNSDPHHFIAIFIGWLEGLASQSKTQTELLFFDIETTLNKRLSSILEKLNQRQNQQEQANLDDCYNGCFASTQFLNYQKNQLIDFQEHLEQYCNVLPVFGFNSAKYDFNLIKSYLLPILVNEQDVEPTFIKKAKQFIPFKYGYFQWLDLKNISGGATNLGSFFKAYKTSEKKDSSPTNGFNTLKNAESRTCSMRRFSQ